MGSTTLTAKTTPEMDLTAIDASSTFLAAKIYAPSFIDEGWLSWLTNSIFVAAVVLLLVYAIARKATRNMKLVPHGAQNFFEFLVEFLYGQVEAIVGPKVAPKAFPLLATIFIFVLTANWFGLLPGVGTVGFATGGGGDSHAMVVEQLPDTGGEKGESDPIIGWARIRAIMKTLSATYSLGVSV